MDELFTIECEVNGFAAVTHLAVRQERSRPLAQILGPGCARTRQPLLEKPRRERHPFTA
jgi:hypothetical protein